MILSAQSVLQASIITPFHDRSIVNGKTFGLSSAGYDVRASFGPGGAGMLRFWSPTHYRGDGGHMFDLVSTMEHFVMPDDVLGVVHDKSSWARRGLAVQNTVIEPGWRGYLTLELTYHGETELIVLQGDPIAQIVFHRLDVPTVQPYRGKYQDQAPGPQEAIDETP